MLTPIDISIYGLYNVAVPVRINVGDVIRRARKAQGWDQETLGEKASDFVITRNTRINKNTVGKVEKDPYSSQLGTVWRLVAALGLTLADVEREAGALFTPRADAETASTPATTAYTPPTVSPAVAAADLPETLRLSAAKGMRRAARLKETRASMPVKTVGTRGKAAQKRRSRTQG